ncbi:MAG: inositol-monophosphatase [Candidatus Saccharibacteria bacterium]|nr:inositol-monophosphatase [Candidatus Saccharibacteria bacterium]
MIDTMKQVAIAAGQFMLGAQDDTDSTEKSNAKDFVTVADIKSQGILADGLRAAFPDAVILSEEDSEPDRAALYEPDFTGFVLDPIDGTYNFKRDMRESAISIGYIEAGQLSAGVIHDPYKNELYEAQVGQGAFRNGEPIRVSSQSSLDGASVATSNSYDGEAMARNLRRHLAIYEQTGVMPWTHCQGSGVLNMTYVACGRFDAFHHNGTKPWDNAAAFLIAQEAGAIITGLHGQTVTFTTDNFLMANPAVHDLLLEVFAALPDELLR